MLIFVLCSIKLFVFDFFCFPYGSHIVITFDVFIDVGCFFSWLRFYRCDVFV